MPLSAPVEGFVGGRRFTKLKVEVPIEEEVKDKLTLTHLTLGDVPIFCSYEKVSRICKFCGLLGHEIASCQDHIRLAAILSSPAHSARPDKSQILAQKFGSWITDPALLPKDETQYESAPSKSIHKRAFPIAANGTSGTERPLNLSIVAPMQVHDSPYEEIDSPSSKNKRPKPAGPIPPDGYIWILCRGIVEVAEARQLPR